MFGEGNRVAAFGGIERPARLNWIDWRRPFLFEIWQRFRAIGLRVYPALDVANSAYESTINGGSAFNGNPESPGRVTWRSSIITRKMGL